MIEIVLVFTWGALLCLAAMIGDAVCHLQRKARSNRRSWDSGREI